LNTHSVNAGTYRSDGPLSTKNTQKIAYYFILLALLHKKVAPHTFFAAARLKYYKKAEGKFTFSSMY